MADEKKNVNGATNPRRKRLVLQFTIGALLLAFFIFLAWYVNSASFHSWVESRLIASIERSTGGRAEIGSMQWNLSKQQFEIRNLTIHGKEVAGEAPFLHVDRMFAQAKINSFLGREISLTSVDVDHPVIHLITYPDGSTNQPVPKQGAGESPVQTLFDLAVGKAVVRNGEFLLNNRAVPFEFAANDVSAQLAYLQRAKRFDGTVNVGKLDGHFQNMRPIAARAQASFSIHPNAIDIKGLNVISGESRLEASGSITDLQAPKVMLQYRASVNLREAGAVARMPQLRGGSVQLNGAGLWSGGELATHGRVQMTNAAWNDPALRVSGVNASADYVMGKTKLLLRKIDGTALGGAFTGNGEVTNWAQSTNAAPHTANLAQRGTAHIDVRDIQASAVSEAVATPILPLDKINAVGSASGTIDATWVGSPSDAQIGFNIAVTPPPQAARDELPVTAHLVGTYDGRREVANFSQLDASTRHTRMNASGSLGAKNAQVTVAATTTDLNEFSPALSAMGQTLNLPVKMAGSASFTGTVSGRLRAPTAVGHLQMTNFDTEFVTPEASPGYLTVFTAPAALPPRVHRLHWDRLSTDLTLSPEQVSFRNGLLQHENAQIGFSGQVNLQGGRFTDTSPFNLHLAIRNADVAQVQPVIGLNYPVTGTLDANLNLSGTELNPRGGGPLTIRNGTIYGEPVQSVSATLNFDGREAQFTNIDLAHGAGHVVGTAAVDLHTNAFRFDLRGGPLRLEDIRALRLQRISIAGQATFTAQGSGTKDAPTLNGNLQLRDLMVNGERVGDVDAQAHTVGDIMQISATSRLVQASALMNGTVRLRGDYPAALTLQFSHFDFDPLLRAYLKGRITGHSSAAGNVSITGPLKRPRDLNIQGNVNQLSAEIENVRVSNQGPIRFSLAHELFTLQQAHFLGPDTDLSASGTISLAQGHQVDMRADGHANLAILHSIDPSLTSSGQVTVAAHVTGAAMRPVVDGRMQVQNGALNYAGLPNGLSELNGTVLFDQNRANVESLTAHTGGGTLKLGGYVTFDNNPSFNLTIAAHDLRVRYPAGVSSMGNADLKLTGNLHDSLLSGDARVLRFALNPEFDFANYLARVKQPLEVANPNSPLTNLHLDVHVTSSPELQVQTSIARVAGEVDLHVRGTWVHPVVLGRVNINQGTAVFNGTKYRLERGDITFSNPLTIDPIMNIEASTRISGYDITLGFHGSPSRGLQTSYRSDPPLPSSDIIALLAFRSCPPNSEFGCTPTAAEQLGGPSVQANTNVTQAASNQILGEALNATLSNRVQKLFGVSRIRIDPEVGTATVSPGTRITIEQQVSNNLTVTYTRDISQFAQQIFEVEYNLGRNVSIIAVQDQYGVLSLDVRVRRRKR